MWGKTAQNFTPERIIRVQRDERECWISYIDIHPLDNTHTTSGDKTYKVSKKNNRTVNVNSQMQETKSAGGSQITLNTRRTEYYILRMFGLCRNLHRNLSSQFKDITTLDSWLYRQLHRHRQAWPLTWSRASLLTHSKWSPPPPSALRAALWQDCHWDLRRGNHGRRRCSVLSTSGSFAQAEE